MASNRRRFLVPEVVQTSAMDCGPACMTSLLRGFGIAASYGRLREACQIDVDGTSIDTIEEVARELGLEAEQIMLPADHLLLESAGALPCMAVVQQPNGLTHFVVIWRRVGRLFQIMDPATGRNWLTGEALRRRIYSHQHPVPADDWRAWAGSSENLDPIRDRLRKLGVDSHESRRMIATAGHDPGWYSLAALDAGIRLTDSLRRAGALRRDRTTTRLLETLVAKSSDGSGDDPGGDQDGPIPASYWSVRRADPEDAGEATLILSGAVVLRVAGRRSTRTEPGATRKLSPELSATLAERPARPGRDLAARIVRQAPAAVAPLMALLLLASAGWVFETLLMRGFLDLGRSLGPAAQRLAGLGALYALLAVLVLAELGLARGVLRLGRRLEIDLRMSFLAKIPLLGDRYFSSRLVSDMAERCHSVHRLRSLPKLGEGALRALFDIVLVTAGILWLDPQGALPALLLAGTALAAPLLVLPTLQEQDLRVRNHTGALGRFYLDALLGLVPLRTHGAELAVRREHESLLLNWCRARLTRDRTVVWLDLALTPLLLAFVTWLILGYVGRGSLHTGALLLVFWALYIFSVGRYLVLLLAQQYPIQRNTALRLLEPLEAPTEESGMGDPGADVASRPAGPVDIELQGVAVKAGGRTILREVDLVIPAGSHVAVVGASGAGKSSLVGLLLGWHRPAAGKLLVDGVPLSGDRLEELREATVWLDPEVHLWNRSLLDNLLYGPGRRSRGSADGTGGASSGTSVGRAIERAQLLSVVQNLPDGLNSPLGESGGLVSGGEGQRVRMGRSLLHDSPRLAILDEPFRGLARDQRGELLERARETWQDATLLCVTHDIAETFSFERVLVMEEGRIVEEGSPRALAEAPESRYRALVEAEEAVRKGLWADPRWRHLRLDRGKLEELATREGGQ